mmetsp:Transcript_76746/g.206826  ORF Transcript_76746/g.206826 Transcript_76746/m.206826 type:complete len:149 (+) Transcript_76746:1851-2297(+)
MEWLLQVQNMLCWLIPIPYMLRPLSLFLLSITRRTNSRTQCIGRNRRVLPRRNVMIAVRFVPECTPRHTPQREFERGNATAAANATANGTSGSSSSAAAAAAAAAASTCPRALYVAGTAAVVESGARFVSRTQGFRSINSWLSLPKTR